MRKQRKCRIPHPGQLTLLGLLPEEDGVCTSPTARGKRRTRRGDETRKRLAALIDAWQIDLALPVRIFRQVEIGAALGLTQKTVRSYLQVERKQRGIVVPRSACGKAAKSYLNPWENRPTVRKRLRELLQELEIDLGRPIPKEQKAQLIERLGTKRTTLQQYLRCERRRLQITVERVPLPRKPRLSRPKAPALRKPQPPIPIPEVLSGADLSRLKEAHRKALTLRYGLDGGRQHTFSELGPILSLTRQGAQMLVKRALFVLANPNRTFRKRGRPSKQPLPAGQDSSWKPRTSVVKDSSAWEIQSQVRCQRANLPPAAFREWLLTQPFQFLGPGQWTPRLAECLEAARVKTVQDLTRLTIDDVLALPYVGRKTLDMILDLLEAQDLDLADG